MKRKRVVLITVLLFAVFAAALFLTFRDTNAILSERPPAQKSRLAFLGSWMWPVKQHLLKLRQSLLGPRQVVHLDAIVAELSPTNSFHALSISRSMTNASGAKVLIVSNPTNFVHYVTNAGGRVVSRPSVSTAEGVQAQVAALDNRPVGNDTNVQYRPVGFWLDAQARVRAESIDLTCFLIANELRRTNTANELLMRTNAAVGARVDLRADASVLLIGQGTNQRGNVACALITPSVTRRR